MFGEKYVHCALCCWILLLVVGVSCLAHLSHIPDSYTFAIDVVMLGIGVVTGLENVRQKDSEY